MNIPTNLRYTDDHEWIRIEEDNIVYIGITDFAQSELGDIVYIDIDSEGATLEKGEIFGSVEAVKTVSDLYMPIAGTILQMNPLLDEESELVNTSPYEDGWMVKVKVTDATQLEALMSAEAYQIKVGA